MSSVRSAWSASVMRLAKASSPDDSSRIPDKFLPASSVATMWPSDVCSGLGSATVCDFSTCLGRLTQPVTTRTSAAIIGAKPPTLRSGDAGAPIEVLRIRASYQAHFAPMQTQRHIRSFVLRAGRTTVAQDRALTELWPTYGLDFGDSAMDLDVIFGRRAPRCLEIGFGIGEVIGSLAENNPHIDYLGIEVHRAGIGRLLLRADQGALRK